MSEDRMLKIFEEFAGESKARCYHVLVAYHVEDFYMYPYAVHLITPEKPLAHEAFRRAEELLDKYFADTWRRGRIKSRFIGIEELPVEVDREYHVVVSFSAGAYYVREIFSNVPEHVAEKIMDYRFRWLTIDIDVDVVKNLVGKDAEEARKALIKAIRELAKLPNAEFYKTKRGYHVRVPLSERKNFNELIEMRMKYLDDEARIDLDKAYYGSGLWYLTNMLFNEKYWYEGDRLVHQVEQPIAPDKIIDEIEGLASKESTAVGNNVSNVVERIEELVSELTSVLRVREAENKMLHVVTIYKGTARIGRLLLSRDAEPDELLNENKMISMLTSRAFTASFNNLPKLTISEPLKAVFFMPNLVYAYTDNALIWLSLDIVYYKPLKKIFKLSEESKTMYEDQIRRMWSKSVRVDETIILDNDKDRVEIKNVTSSQLLGELRKQYNVVACTSES